MNEPIEKLLREMPLARPSGDLDRRVLAGRRQRPRLLRLGAAMAAGAAAAAVLVAILATRAPHRPAAGPMPVAVATNPVTPAGTADLKPVRIEQNWSAIEYQGVVDSPEQGPLRAFRQQTLQRMVILDENGRPTEVTVPRQNVILVSAEQY